MLFLLVPDDQMQGFTQSELDAPGLNKLVSVQSLHISKLHVYNTRVIILTTQPSICDEKHEAKQGEDKRRNSTTTPEIRE